MYQKTLYSEKSWGAGRSPARRFFCVFSLENGNFDTEKQAAATKTLHYEQNYEQNYSPSSVHKSACCWVCRLVTLRRRRRKAAAAAAPRAPPRRRRRRGPAEAAEAAARAAEEQAAASRGGMEGIGGRGCGVEGGGGTGGGVEGGGGTTGSGGEVFEGLPTKTKPAPKKQLHLSPRAAEDFFQLLVRRSIPSGWRRRGKGWARVQMARPNIPAMPRATALVFGIIRWCMQYGHGSRRVVGTSPQLTCCGGTRARGCSCHLRARCRCHRRCGHQGRRRGYPRD